MILFQSDIERYPNAIFDLKTTNVSFIRMSAMLRDMGVKNHLFPLQLHNPSLVGVDPYSPYLTTAQIIDIAVECKVNFWYYIREIARASNGSSDPIRFRANRGNMALYWLFFNHIMTILIQIRQTGKSFSSDHLSTYLLNIRCEKTQINLLTKDDTLRSANLERLKTIEADLPFYLRRRTKNDIGNTEMLAIASNGNSYRGHLPSKSVKMAANVGRGLTSPTFLVDEAAFFYNIEHSLPAALAAGTAAREIAARNGDPYGTILTTTAGKKDDRDGGFMYGFVQDAATWTEKMYDAESPEDLEKMIRGSSRAKVLRVNATFNHRQLGYTDEWLKKAIEDSTSKGDDAKRDFGNIWSSGSQSSPLPTYLLEIIRGSERSEFHPEISGDSYITRWYYPENQIETMMATFDHVISIDSSDAAGGDDIALTIRSVRTGAIIAAGNYNETNLIGFAKWLASWLIKYPKLTLIIERRSTGAMIIDYLLLILPAAGIDPFTRIYNKVVQEADEQPERLLEVQRAFTRQDITVYVKYKKTFGFATSGTGATSRTELYSTTLLSCAKHTGHLTHDKKTIDQILGLIVRNGRVDHGEGEHDDMCISALLNFWMLSLGRNLHHYGIQSRDILVDNKVNQRQNSPSNLQDEAEQNRYKAEANRLYSELRQERDTYVASRLEDQFRNIMLKIKDNGAVTLSVDELLGNLRDLRNTESFHR